MGAVPVPQGATLGSPDGMPAGAVPVPQGASVGAPGLQSQPEVQQAAPEPQGQSSFMVPGPQGAPIRVAGGGGNEAQQAYTGIVAQGAKPGLAAVGATVAPELLPEEIGGSGVLGYITRLLSRSGAAGAGAAVGNAAGQAAQGQNPLTSQNLKESGKVGLGTAALAAPFEAVGLAGQTKLGRAAVNQSVGATARDVTYGNPAKALFKEGISSPQTGDIEAYKAALREGKTQEQAMQAAGGRMAAVNTKVSALSRQVDSALSTSPATLKVQDVIDKPLDDAVIDIIGNRAMTPGQKDAALHELGGLQQSLKQGLGTDVTLAEAQKIKQQMGNQIAWLTDPQIPNQVKEAHKAVYGALKNGIHNALPKVAEADERLSDLLAARQDLTNLSRAEEVGRGAGLTRGTIGKTALGVAESSAGRVLPGAAKSAKVARPVVGGLVDSVVNNEQ